MEIFHICYPNFPAYVLRVSKQTKMAFNMDMAARSYRNLTLSFRGSERQSPNCLQLALRFSWIMEQRALEGAHLASASTEERLREIVSEFHSSPGLNAKHRLDEEKFRSVLNTITGTCAVPWEVVSTDFDFAGLLFISANFLFGI